MNRRRTALSVLPFQEIQMNSKSLFHSTTFAVLLAAGLLVVPVMSQAQEAAVAEVVAPAAAPATAPAVAVETTVPAQPVLAGPRITRAGVTHITADVAPEPFRRDATRRNTSWMIVGGVMLLVGVVIGGDAGTIVALTGGAIGLVGLFRYLQ
jgi:hypothetical protein